MYPNASVSGLYFANPSASYFFIGEIDKNQKEEYARKRGFSEEQLKKYIR